MGEPILRVDHVATGYGDLRVVWDVSLDVWPGKVTALLGRNGSGKTTTLRAVAGLNRLHEGRICYDGTDLGEMAPHKRVARGISYVQEGKRVFRDQTVEENLLVGGISLRRSRASLAVDVEEMYELFPVLRDKRSESAGALSGGQQQMVAICQALMARPRLLLLDEPSGGLAPAIVAEVMDRVSRLKATGLAILLIEQAVQAAVSIADHVTVINVGRVTYDSSVKAISDMEELRGAAMGAHRNGDAPHR